MKSLEKDRVRRYGTVSTLLDDIQRHLRNEPVSAGPPSAWYRTGKFVVRHRTLLAATAAVGIVVVAGLIVSLALYLRAERAREKEAAARTEAQTVADFLTDDLLASVHPERAKGQEVTVRYILKAASANLESKFQKSPVAEAKIRQAIGLTYQKLGDYQAAEPHLQRALEIRRQRLGEAEPLTLSSLHHLGTLHTDQGRYTAAEPLLLKAVEMRRKTLGEEHPDTLASMGDLAWLYLYEGRVVDGDALVRSVLRNYLKTRSKSNGHS
jgi:non-specific serine/threonine protein kinase/serine/threonine-protein kinase